MQVPGPEGTPGTNGTNGLNGGNAYTTTTASFLIPSAGSPVSGGIAVTTTTFMAIGQYLYISDGTNEGIFKVTSITSATTANVTYIVDPINTQAGNTMSNGANVTPSGFNGTNGTAGNNAYTTTTSNFTSPASYGSTVSIPVANTAWMSVGMYVAVSNGPSNTSINGIYQVQSITNGTSFVGIYPNFTQNTNLNTGVTSGATVTFSIPGNVAPITFYSSGTAYTVTATPSVIALSGGNAVITITTPGTWRITGRARYDIATNTAFSATASNNIITTTLKSSVSGNIAPSGIFVVQETPNGTACTIGIVDMSPIFYTTANATDTISLFSSIVVIPSSGSLTVTEASIIAEFIHT